MLLETRPLIEFALANVHICTLEICQPPLIQTRNGTSRPTYVIEVIFSVIRNPSAVSASFLPLCSLAVHRSAHRSARRRFPAIAGAPPMRLQSTRFVSFKCQRAQAHMSFKHSLNISILCDFLYANL